MTKTLEKLKIEEIFPYENNPRFNDKAAVEVAESIKQCGYCAPIVVDEKHVILAGHTRYKALQRLGWEEVEVLTINGMTATQKKKYRLLDNKVGETAEWDFGLLGQELEDLDFGDLDIDWELPDPFEEEQKHQEFKDKTLDMATDILNTGKAQFAGAGYYDIPILQPLDEMPEIDKWIPFDFVMSDKQTDAEKKRTAVHFFRDDYKFERVWNSPDTYIDMLSKYAVVASPDFSPIIGLPMATQIFNHYRKHWCGAYWQMHGLKVIPTITGGVTEQAWYLDGEPEGGYIVTSAMWTESERWLNEFLKTLDDIIERLRPKGIYVYGKLPKETDTSRCPIIQIDSWKKEVKENGKTKRGNAEPAKKGKKSLKR